MSRRAWLRRTLDVFWNAPGSPVNLAIFRVVLFTTFFFSVDLSGAVWYSRMPAELRIAPVGLRHIIPHLPISPGLARVAGILLLIFCALAVVGLFTHLSCWLTVVLGLYVLGLADLYGKVNHLHHHLIWFAALLAVSPCADVLSLDAWRKNSRQREWPADSPKYARPLRFVWLLMGVIYFFPGLWKLMRVGPSWASPGNMRLQMYLKWMEFDNWTPLFRIDLHPTLCALCGTGTIAFEISFIFLVFFRRTHPFLIPAGLAFHNLTYLFMRISFWPLQTMYLSFVDWDTLARRLFPKRDRAGPLGEVSPECSNALVFVGTFLLVANIGFGLARISEAWPFACFPTFAFRATAQRQVLTVAVETENAQIIELNRTALSREFPPDRERGLEEALIRIKDPAQKSIRLCAFWELWLQNHSELGNARMVRFYRDTRSTVPEKEQRLLHRELLLTLPLHV